MTRSSERACFIVNPRSAGGATGRRLPEVARAAAEHFAAFDIRQTERPGHASELAARAVADGFELVVAVGGDGTAHEVVNGLFDGDRPRSPSVVFASLPAGTGSDLVRTLDVPRPIDAAMAVAAHGETRRSDVLSVSCTHAGARVHRMAINVVGFGGNGEVVRRANRSSKRLGGRLTFLKATVGMILQWRPRPVEVTWVDETGAERAWQGILTAAFLGNGAYCGGGMWVGRGGSMQDGWLDLLLVPALPTVRQLVLLPKLFDGTAERVEGVVRARAVRVSARPLDDRDVLVETDGEQPGILPMDVEVCRGALHLRGKWGIRSRD